MTYANAIGYTDITPYEVVRTVSPTCLEVREMAAALDPSWTPDFVVGGFSAHCRNNGSQRWVIESNPTGRVVRIRLHKSGEWKSAHGDRFKLADKPVKRYDYNF